MSYSSHEESSLTRMSVGCETYVLSCISLEWSVFLTELGGGKEGVVFDRSNIVSSSSSGK